MSIPNLSEIIADYTEFSGVHPIAEVFPMKPEDEFNELVEHIRANGVTQKLLREKETGLLVDGRNRLLAISITRSLFQVQDIESRFVLMHATANNLHAKKFTASQRSMIAVRLEPMYAAEAKERQKLSEGAGVKGPVILPDLKGDARDAAAKAAGTSGSYVSQAKRVASVDIKIADDVLNGKKTLKEALVEVAPIIAAQKAAKAEKLELTNNQHDATASIVTPDGTAKEIKLPKNPVFNETNDNVSWANWTWNPVTGCEHGCKFCYAREIASSQRMAEIYPFGFAPAFHEYRLSAPKNTKYTASEDSRDGRVFVCSMADLFGKWVPDDWIAKVFAACAASPQWEYLFLTKWPKRYQMLASLPKAWFGASIIQQSDVARVTRDMTAFPVHKGIVRWVSLEPMLGPIEFGDIAWCDLMVIGGQTSTRQPDGFVPEFAPKFEWVADVVAQCRAQGVPYYLKPNLRTSPGMQLTQMEPRRAKA